MQKAGLSPMRLSDGCEQGFCPVRLGVFQRDVQADQGHGGSKAILPAAELALGTVARWKLRRRQNTLKVQHLRGARCVKGPGSCWRGPVGLRRRRSHLGVALHQGWCCCVRRSCHVTVQSTKPQVLFVLPKGSGLVAAWTTPEPEPPGPPTTLTGLRRAARCASQAHVLKLLVLQVQLDKVTARGQGSGSDSGRRRFSKSASAQDTNTGSGLKAVDLVCSGRSYSAILVVAPVVGYGPRQSVYHELFWKQLTKKNLGFTIMHYEPKAGGQAITCLSAALLLYLTMVAEPCCSLWLLFAVQQSDVEGYI